MKSLNSKALLLAVAFVGISFVLNQSSYGQDEKSGENKDAAQAADDSTYVDLLTDWKAKEDQLKAMEAEYVGAGQGRKNEIRSEYNKLLDEVKTLMPELRNKAIAAYEKNPNQDESLVRLLVGMLTDDLHKNRYDSFFELGDVLIKGKIDIKHLKAIHDSKRLVSFGIEYPIDELIARHADAKKNDLPRAIIKTTNGDVEIELFEDSAPNHVANFISLASKGFYTESEWHRVDKLQNVVQGGKHKDGEELDYTLEGEWNNPNRRRHFKGHVGAARTPEPNSASSQFYIVTDRVPGFDVPGNSYTVFGRVIKGMEHVHTIEQGHKMIGVEIIRKRDHEYVPTPYKPEEAPKEADKKGPAKTTDAPKGEGDKSKTEKPAPEGEKKTENKEPAKTEKK